MKKQRDYCTLCERDLNCTFHHLIPKSTHKTKAIRKRYSREERSRGIWVCRMCHNAIHTFIPNRMLAMEYNTARALLEHEDIHRYLQWAKKQNKVKFYISGKSS